MQNNDTQLDSSQGNQEFKYTSHGGSRQGAGRKSMNGGEEVTRKMKRKFNEYVTEEQIEQIVAASIADALNGKTDMQKFLLEQWFGKATQRNELSGPDGIDLPTQVLVKFVGDGNQGNWYTSRV